VGDVDTEGLSSTERTARRRRRQREEISSLLAAGQVHHAADLAHEHLSEFPDDGDVREAVIAALRVADRGSLRRRVEEFRATGRP
jgi:hypothetical protein